MFENYSPQNLRDAIEFELQKTGDAKLAAAIAIGRLKKNPDYYQDLMKARLTKAFGQHEEMTKAKDTTKLTKKVITNKKGKQQTVYVRLSEEPKKETNWMQRFMGIFGFKDKSQVMQKVQADYKVNGLDKKGVTWDSWKTHVSEYFTNKAKWDNFFSGKKEKKEPTESRQKTDSKATEKKVKKDGLKLSLMKVIFGLYGGIKQQQPKEQIKEPTIEKKSPAIKETMSYFDLNTVKDIEKYLSIKSKEYGSESKFFESEEYKKAFPVINEIYKQERSNFDTMPEEMEDIKKNFERWKSGDLTGIEGNVFRIVQELSDGRKKILFNDVASIDDVKNGFISYRTTTGDTGGISQKTFIEMLKNGLAIPIEMESTIQTDNGSKIEQNVKLTENQKEERIKDEEAAAREGYYNEKPAEILNVGTDTWGAARHRYDTYERFNADVNLMEKDGTARAYVTKKNLLGENGLSNKDERVKNGETEHKVLASFCVRDFLPKMPENSEESRKKYMEFLRAVTRIDNETKTSNEFLAALSDFYGNMFLSKDDEKNKPKRDGIPIVGEPLHVLFTTVLGNADKSILYSLGKKERNQFTVVSKSMIGEKNGTYSYDELKTDLIGRTKSTGIKLKKGDNFILNESLKENFYAIKTEYKDGFSRGDYILAKNELNSKFDPEFVFYSLSRKDQFPEKIKNLEEFLGQPLPEKDAETQALFRKKVEEAFDILDDKYLISEKIYPEKIGQIIKAGKDKIQVAFNFPDGKIRSFHLKPEDIKPENIESVKKSVDRQKSVTVNLYVERQVLRTGGKNFGDISIAAIQEKLEKEFKVKTLQYGNSMPDAERQYHTKWTLEAFSDLSDILNIPIEQITVNGKLGMAFGARGKPIPGLTGGAMAHYEPSTKMINLTRANGTGSLAHEWGHFLDNIMTKNMQGFLTDTVEYKKEKFNSKEEIPHGSIYEVEGRKKTTRYFFDKNAKNPDYPFVKLNSGQAGPGNKPEYVGFRRYNMELQVPQEDPEIVSLAKQISKKSKDWLQTYCTKKIVEGDERYREMAESYYLNDEQETFARAFEAYIADKLEGEGRQNTYLSSQKKTISLDGYAIYPQENHRKEINILFDRFFDKLRGSDDLKKAIDRFSKNIIMRKCFNEKTQSFEYKMIK